MLETSQLGNGQAAALQPIRGTKRKSYPARAPSPKKYRPARASPKPYAHENHKEDRSSQDEDDSEFSESEEEEEALESAITTPLTPYSAGSPQRPSDRKSIPCTFDGCPKFFNRQAKLLQHLRSHTNTRPFVCPHAPCPKTYLRDSHLKHHIKSAHTQERNYVCPRESCGQAFVTGTRLRKHIALHEDKAPLTCTIDGCGQVFRKHSTMQRHIKKVHEGEEPIVCAFLGENGKMCGMGFNTPWQLRAHEGRMHARKTFECTICEQNDRLETEPRAFSTYLALQQHIKVDHPPMCELCGLKCASKSALKSHVEVKHADRNLDERKKFICPEQGCGAGFTKKGNMNVHIQSAHGSKRYVCGEVDLAKLNNVEGWDRSSACGVACVTKANLQEHIRTAHLGLPNKNTGRARRQEKTARRNGASAVDRITGTGGVAGSSRFVPCAITGCSDHFSTDYDLEIHLQARHGLADIEIQDLLPEDWKGEALIARPGLQGAMAYATHEDLEAENAFDGEDFWLGGTQNGRANTAGEWLRDEAEMHQLIDDNYGLKLMGEASGQDEMNIYIDPTLQGQHDFDTHMA